MNTSLSTYPNLTTSNRRRETRGTPNSGRRPQRHPPSAVPKQQGSCAGERDSPRGVGAVQGTARGTHARSCLSRWVVVFNRSFIVTLCSSSYHVRVHGGWVTNYTTINGRVRIKSQFADHLLCWRQTMLALCQCDCFTSCPLIDLRLICLTIPTEV